MPSFDIVSIVNVQEVKNAVEHVRKEISTRYDFKGSKSSVEYLEDKSLIVVIGDDKMKLQALQELLKQKLAKRGVSPKSVKFEDPTPAASDTLRQQVIIKQGLSDEEVKKINKSIKGMTLKVSSQIQGDQIRVTGKKRDDLQAVIAQLRKDIADLELQFVNFRD